MTRGELRSLAVPAVVLTGSATRAHVVEDADALAALMPQATRAVDGDIAGAVRSLISAS